MRALVVYNSNPAAIAPDRERILTGLARKDLFTVVMEHFQTDTADWADVLLPATTQLEHWDIHKGYGHLYVMLNQPVIEPVGESLPNTEIFRRIAKQMGVTHPALDDSDETMIRQALKSDAPSMQGITFERLRDEGPQRLSVPSPHLPYPRGTRLPTPSGRIEIECESLSREGLDPLPLYIPPWESEERDPALAARYPLTLISPPAHSFLNSTFVNVDRLRRAEGSPVIEVHPEDAETRGLQNGIKAQIWNDRGRFTADVVVTDRVKRGVVSAPSVWWAKLTADGTNANQTTSQRLTDLGGGATFYDNLVEVGPAHA